jgi:hypothetical protein
MNHEATEVKISSSINATRPNILYGEFSKKYEFKAVKYLF